MTSPSPNQTAILNKSVVVASFARSGHDNFARSMERHGLLAFYALGTRRGTTGVTRERTRLNPVFGLLNYAAAKCLSPFYAESFRYRLYPLFDRWVRSLLHPGQSLITSFGFANSSLEWIRRHGGSTFIDAENSHPNTFWEVLSEEHKRWGSRYPPVSRFYNRLGAKSVDHADYIFAPSAFVQNSFVEQGFDRERIWRYTLPTNLEWFHPAPVPRPKSRPLTLLNTGALCLRKGTPYLLEAFRLIRKKEPNAVLRLSRTVTDDIKGILRRHSNLPIEWSPYYDLRFEEQRRQYVARFQTSDLFVFPSIEDGFAFVVAEALASGVPVITTANTGASDLIRPGDNGDIVPIRNPEALANAVLNWWARIRKGYRPTSLDSTRQSLNFDTFDRTIMNYLTGLGAR
jgi:glycosyltransferase involved in cell wall biosynthesis